MKQSTIRHLLIGISICGSIATAWSAPVLTKLAGTAKGISADGKSVVGYDDSEWDPDWTYQLHSSFLWNAVDGQKWITSYDGSNYDESGLFYGITDTGIITGAIKNKNMRLPASQGGIFKPATKGNVLMRENEEELGQPIFTAAVWKDGKVYMLDDGLGSIDFYEDPSDGSYATASSDDGKTVVGYFWKAWQFDRGAVWTYNENTDSYEIADYAMPDGTISGHMLGISEDGKIILGNIVRKGENGGVTSPIYWTSPEDYVIIDLPQKEFEIGQGASAMSPDGKKILVYGTGYTQKYLAVYDTDLRQLSEVRIPDGAQSLVGLAVTDAGDAFFKITDSNWNEVNYFCSYGSNVAVPLTSYAAGCSPDISSDELDIVSSSDVIDVSADGKEVVLKKNGYDSLESSVLHLENIGGISVASPSDVRMYYIKPGTVKVEWKGIDEIPEGVELNGYQIVFDGNIAGDMIESSTPGEILSATLDAPMGMNHSVALRTVFTNEGKVKTSAESEMVSTYVSADTSLIEYDNFDDSELDAFGNPLASNDHWKAESVVDNMMVISWCLDVRDWENNNPFATVTSTADSPWANAFVSHYRDASEASDFFLSFYTCTKEVNILGQDRSTDYLDVEYTLDGKNWEPLLSLCAADMEHAKWSFHKIPLGDKLAGKVFRIRFNAHGEGRAMLSWSVDCIGINDEMEAEIPTGLRASKREDGDVELIWHNTVSTWDISHLINSSVECDKSAASEGRPVMMAIDIDAERVKRHAGEYISGVSAFLFDYPEASPSEVEAVVFEDGVEIARGYFQDTFNQVCSSTAWLDEPVMIKAGSNYRIAIDLIDYDETNAPMYYQNTPDAISGVSDLFSEDGGKTWQTMKDAFEAMYPGDDQSDLRKSGDCIWSIHANISDSDRPVDSYLIKDSEIIGYNIFRDGKQINKSVIYAPYMRYIDNDAPETAEYAVQAFYRDGRISPVSEPFKYSSSSVKDIQTSDIRVLVEADAVIISGEFGIASLYDLSGKRISASGSSRISTSGLTPGMYLLKVNSGDNTSVFKLIIK